MGSRNDLKWCMNLYPKGFDHNYSDYVSLFLQLEGYDQGDIKIKYKFSILNSKKAKTNEIGSESDRKFTPGCDWGFREFILRDSLFDTKNGLLPDNKLTICCDIELNKRSSASVYGDSAAKLSNNVTSVLDDLEGLLKSKCFCDVTFVLGEKKFHAHKAILAARSPVFAAMFESNMQEKQSNVVSVVDIDDKVMADILQFIYTGRIDNLRKTASNILPAADKYALEGLKDICEDAISKSLSVDNAAEILTLADCHNASKLKQDALNFIIFNGQSVTESQGFKEIVASQPHLVAEAFKVLVSNFLFYLILFPLDLKLSRYLCKESD